MFVEDRNEDIIKKHGEYINDGDGLKGNSGFVPW